MEDGNEDAEEVVEGLKAEANKRDFMTVSCGLAYETEGAQSVHSDCRNDCRNIPAKYDIWGVELRQVAAFHREITAFCRYLMSY